MIFSQLCVQKHLLGKLEKGCLKMFRKRQLSMFSVLTLRKLCGTIDKKQFYCFKSIPKEPSAFFKRNPFSPQAQLCRILLSSTFPPLAPIKTSSSSFSSSLLVDLSSQEEKTHKDTSRRQKKKVHPTPDFRQQQTRSFIVPCFPKNMLSLIYFLKQKSGKAFPFVANAISRLLWRKIKKKVVPPLSSLG